MKKQLKFGFFIVFFLACAFVLWLFVMDKIQQIPTNKSNDINTSKQNEANSSLQNLTTSQDLIKFTQMPEQNSTQTNQQKRVKGLFVDYDESDFNVSEFEINEFKSEKNSSVNLSTTSNSNTLNEINASLIFDASKTALFLVPAKRYVDLFAPMKDDYFRFLRFKKVDKNADTKRQKPKLCIIIDDMASREQVNELKATGLKLTPSFFPADKNHPKTPSLAREFDFFMVHLPLMAIRYTYEERETLSPSDSQEQINAKIAQIVRDFSGVKFINNHTGSLFTNDTQAMRRLFRALKEHNLIFVDSRTIGSSKGALVSREFNQTPIKRDIFLDNENDINAIKAKIKKAVQIAHKKGFAIAIAHPKKNTFKALKQSKKLLQSVELVYLSELYANP